MSTMFECEPFPDIVVGEDLNVDLSFYIGATTVNMSIPLKQGQNLSSSLRRVFQQHHVPIYLESSLLSVARDVVLNAMNAKQQQPGTPNEIVENSKILAERYEKEWTLFSQRPSEPLFPTAFHSLIHSPGNALEVLLQLENTYSQAISQIVLGEKKALELLQQKHSNEMELLAEGKSKISSNDLVKKQVEEMENLNQKWKSELKELKNVQRHDYREFVMNEFNNRLKLNTKQKQNQGQNQNQLETEPQSPIIDLNLNKEITNSNSNQISNSNETSKPQQNGPTVGTLIDISTETTPQEPTKFETINPEFQKKMKELQEMGFDEASSECALNLEDWNVERAIILLLEHPEKIAQVLNSSNQPPKKSREKTNSTSTSTPSSSTSTLNYLFQQKPKKLSLNMPSLSNLTSSAPESITGAAQTLVNSAWSRIGTFRSFTKGTQSEENPSNQSLPTPIEPMSESFTIQLGAQMKTNCNLRLLVSDSSSFFKGTGDQQQDNAYRAQTIMTIYSQNLSGIVVLVTVDNYEKYCKGLGGNIEFFSCCSKTTEFHFDDIEEQFQKINEEQPTPTPGDIFITRHSNIPLFHVVFHLIIDSKPLTQELSQRQPVMNGLLSIFRMAHQFDISLLSLPLLLLPDSLAPMTTDFSLCTKRGESLFKSVKAFLNESVRQTKNSVVAQRTIQFTLPERTTPEQFQTLRSLLSSIYRTN